MKKDPYKEGYDFRRKEVDHNTTVLPDGTTMWKFIETREQFLERHKRKDEEAPKYPKNSYEQDEWYSGWFDCDHGTGRE